MKRIHTSLDQLSVGHVVSLLEQAGIEYIVRNQYLSGAMGELPVNECWPEVWITHDEDFYTANELVLAVTGEIRDAGPWQCSNCSEHNEGQFASCWHCGRDRQN